MGALVGYFMMIKNYNAYQRLKRQAIIYQHYINTPYKTPMAEMSLRSELVGSGKMIKTRIILDTNIIHPRSFDVLLKYLAYHTTSTANLKTGTIRGNHTPEAIAAALFVFQNTFTCCRECGSNNTTSPSVGLPFLVVINCTQCGAQTTNNLDGTNLVMVRTWDFIRNYI